MKIRLEKGVYETFLIVAEDHRDILIQSDWDFPRTASTFGWKSCPCGQTDGTVDCAHKTRSQMMTEAAEFLEAHVGITVDDSGYF